MGTSQLNDYTAGRKNPGPDIVARWARLGLNVNWWLTGDGEMEVAEAQRAIYITDGEIILSVDDIRDAIDRKRKDVEKHPDRDTLYVTVRKGVPPVTSGDFAPLVPEAKEQKA